jgi:hypothetical protein
MFVTVAVVVVGQGCAEVLELAMHPAANESAAEAQHKEKEVAHGVLAMAVVRSLRNRKFTSWLNLRGLSWRSRIIVFLVKDDHSGFGRSIKCRRIVIFGSL